MNSKIKLAGHPVHPMLVAFPVACYVGTLAGFAVPGTTAWTRHGRRTDKGVM